MDDEDIKSFSCRIENVKSITDILNCLCIDLSKGQQCHVEATPNSKSLLTCFTQKLHKLTYPYSKIQKALFFIVTGKGKATQVGTMMPSMHMNHRGNIYGM
jgi:hypothetical protein